jgi:hypothetical protein
MRNNYPFIRDAVLEERMWTFATARASSISQTKDEWDSMYVHPSPPDWISVFRVYRNHNHRDYSWRMEGGNILSKYTSVLLWGLERVTDTGKFSPLFVQALAARIAADAAIPLTENRSLQSDMWNLYDAKLSAAAAKDGMQGSNDRTTSDRLINVRGSW